jgi:hypothetical protein
MGDWGGAPGTQGGQLAERLGLAMARKAADILSRRRADPVGADGALESDRAQFAADDAVFSAVLDAANECLAGFDGRPARDRWCDALLQVLRLAEFDTRI